jgi:hypothetical protein
MHLRVPGRRNATQSQRRASDSHDSAKKLDFG